MADLKPPLSGFSLWFMARKEDHRSLQNLIDHLAKHFGTHRFEAHATLMGLLEMTDEQPVLHGAELIASEGTSFDVEIIGSASREKYFQSVFLTCVPAPEALRLNERARGFPHHENDPPFMLHWSGVYGDLEPHFKRMARHDIEERISFPLTVTVNEIAAVNCTGYPDEWKIVKRFPLKRK